MVLNLGSLLTLMVPTIVVQQAGPRPFPDVVINRTVEVINQNQELCLSNLIIQIYVKSLALIIAISEWKHFCTFTSTFYF